jgi:glycosyltransferase involved in cell wall biosynthesis
MKLLIVTQAHDLTHPVLGFFAEWIEEFQRHPSISEVRVIATNGRGSRLGRVFRFWATILSDRSDVVFVHMTPLWVLLGWPIWMWRRTRIALWYTHGSDSWLLRRAVDVTTVTFTATKKAFPFYHGKVQVVGHGIAPTFAAVPRATRPDDRYAFLAVGRISPRKRVRETLALFAQIRRIEPQATLTWIGPFLEKNDVYAARVLQDLEFFGIKDAVTIGKSVLPSDMPQVYATHDLLLHLSQTGSLDKVVVEALAAGCPILSTSPATGEALGNEWFWGGHLDGAASSEALSRLRAGVVPGERVRVSQAFALTALIDRLVRGFTFPV